MTAHRNGQGHFLPHAMFKTKKASSEHVVFCIAATYSSKVLQEDEKKGM